MRNAHAALATTLATMICTLMAGCGDAATDYGAFSYSAPSGWTKYEPPTGITLGEGVVEFNPTSMKRQDAPSFEIREVTELSRTERIPPLYARTHHQMWRNLCERAEINEQPEPAFVCDEVPPLIPGPGTSEGLSLTFERDGKAMHQLVHWIRLSDGRRFRALYRGVEPDFSTHLPEIKASLATLTFDSLEAAPALSHEETVGALVEHLDDERLWITDGRVRGQILSDRHMQAFADPAFAGVTDLNLVADYNAMGVGVEVTDEGLKHITHLPLEFLCLRGSLVTDAGLAQLKDLPLETLVLGGTLVTGEGLEHLAGLPLRALDLEGTDVGDDDLEHLAGMKLLSVNLRNTRVTEAGLAKMQGYAPRAHVNH